MEISTKERYFYISTLPLMIAGLLFMLFYYAPWANPNEICDKTKIISKPMEGAFEDFTFKIGEEIKLSLETKGELKSYNWYFGTLKDSILSGSKNYIGNVIFYEEKGDAFVEVKLNDACHISKKLVITNNCNDSIKNGDETGVDCGGSCRPCTVVKEERKRNPRPKKDKYEIIAANSNLECDEEYVFTCRNITKNTIEKDGIYWIFDEIDTPLNGNPREMTFKSKETYVKHRISAFKRGKVLATKTITVKCDNI